MFFNQVSRFSFLCDPLKVEDNRNGSYGVTYSPTSAGMHKVSQLTCFSLFYCSCFHFPQTQEFAITSTLPKISEQGSESFLCSDSVAEFRKPNI